ncbi:MAG TPA: HNH endonuclease signature motif containing protein [Acidimicrobiales bacterium]|nr:HNH endonuclease signature motif containing protein [Acidimicrobiales bacterium]
MPDRCLVLPTEALHGAADVLRSAVDALVRSDESQATKELTQLEDAPFRTYWTAGGVEWERRHQSAAHLPPAVRRVARPIPAATRRAVGERDGWRCRYCGLRLIARDVITALNASFPALFPWGATDLTKHAAGLVLLYTPDHVVPWRAGGDNTPENLVAACGTCNYMKGSCLLEELDLADPRARQPVQDEWTGLSGILSKPKF